MWVLSFVATLSNLVVSTGSLNALPLLNTQANYRANHVQHGPPGCRAHDDWAHLACSIRLL